MLVSTDCIDLQARDGGLGLVKRRLAVLLKVETNLALIPEALKGSEIGTFDFPPPRPSPVLPLAQTFSLLSTSDVSGAARSYVCGSRSSFSPPVSR